MDCSFITVTMKELPYLLAMYLKKQNSKELGAGGKALGPPLFYGHGVSDDWLVRAKCDAKQSLNVVTSHFDRKQSDRFYWMVVVAVK